MMEDLGSYGAMHFLSWQLRAIVLGLTASLFLWAPACAQDDSGQVLVRFSWTDAPAPGTRLYVTARVDDAASQEVLAASPATAMIVGAPAEIALPPVVVGQGRQVFIELRERESLDQRVLYYGRSAVFDLRAGQQVSVDVALALQVPETERGNAVGIRFLGVANPSTLADPRQLRGAILRLETARGVEILVSNDPSLKDPLIINPAAPPPGVACGLGSFGCAESVTCCEVSGWDLTTLDPSPPNGVFNVYARFLDRWGYASETVLGTVQVDATGPELLYSALSRPFVPTGEAVVVSITASEPIKPPQLSLHPAPDFDIPDATLGAGGNWLWALQLPDDAESRSYELRVTMQDLYGNPEVPEAASLTAGVGAGSGLLYLSVDGMFPRIADAAIIVDHGSFNITHDASTIWLPPSVADVHGWTVVLTLTDDWLRGGPPSVRMGDEALDCEVTAAQGATLSITCQGVSLASLGEGAAPVVIRATDLADRESVLSPFTVIVDDTPATIAGLPLFTREPTYGPGQPGPSEVYLRPGDSASLAFATSRGAGGGGMAGAEGAQRRGLG